MTLLRPDIVLNLSVPGRYLVQLPSPHLLPYLMQPRYAPLVVTFCLSNYCPTYEGLLVYQ